MFVVIHNMSNNLDLVTLDLFNDQITLGLLNVLGKYLYNIIITKFNMHVCYTYTVECAPL